MMRQSITRAALVASFVALAGVSGCSSFSRGGGGGGASGGNSGVRGPGDKSTTIAPEAFLGRWTLVNLEGQDVGPILSEQLRAPDMEITPEGGITGFAGVNRYSGSVDPTRLARGEFPSGGAFASTKMAGPPEANQLENRFLTAIARADRFDVQGNQLRLKQGDQVVMTFTRPL
ncbi:MAG: META domain-containing protein [Planctomycetota bacterium]|nr:META domain-containing protein [Planctomycetota bacterium]